MPECCFLMIAMLRQMFLYLSQGFAKHAATAAENDMWAVRQSHNLSIAVDVEEGIEMLAQLRNSSRKSMNGEGTDNGNDDDDDDDDGMYQVFESSTLSHTATAGKRRGGGSGSSCTDDDGDAAAAQYSELGSLGNEAMYMTPTPGPDAQRYMNVETNGGALYATPATLAHNETYEHEPVAGPGNLHTPMQMFKVDGVVIDSYGKIVDTDNAAAGQDRNDGGGGKGAGEEDSQMYENVANC